MAFVATALTLNGAKQHSIGPIKVQYFTWSVASADVAGTITATGLTKVLHCELSGGLNQTTLPSYSTNVVTLAFADPVATLVGQARVYGY